MHKINQSQKNNTQEHSKTLETSHSSQIKHKPIIQSLKIQQFDTNPSNGQTTINQSKAITH